MKKNRTEDRFICPECGCDEYEIEEDWDEFDGEQELLAKDIVCSNCGYSERLY